MDTLKIKTDIGKDKKEYILMEINLKDFYPNEQFGTGLFVTENINEFIKVMKEFIESREENENE